MLYYDRAALLSVAEDGNEQRFMDLRQLRTFHAVAELGSLSKAADTLRIAQPSLSRQIKLLEHELRVELFVRSGRGMELTGAGQTLLTRTAGLIRQIEQVRDDIQSVGGIPSGKVILGLVPTVSAVLAARFAKRATAELPYISIRMIESYGGHLVDWMHRGEMDLAITYGPAADLHLNVRPIGRENLVAVGPKGSGLSEMGQVTIDWLVKQKLVLPSLAHGMRMLIEKAAARRNLALKALIEADSYRIHINLVKTGLCYTVLPASALSDEIAEGTLEIAPFVSPPLSRELILASPVAPQPSIATTAISALLLDEVAQMSQDGLWDIRLERHADDRDQ